MSQDTLAELARLAEQLRTQDNAITSDPLFVVQRHTREVGWDPDYTEEIAWIDGANEDYVYPDVDPERHQRLEAAYLGEIDWPEYETTHEEEWTRTGYRWKWEFVQAFLTREAAEAFRAAQAHNIGESRVYVESAHRNPEWRLLRELIATLPEFCAEQRKAGALAALDELYKLGLNTSPMVVDINGLRRLVESGEVKP